MDNWRTLEIVEPLLLVACALLMWDQITATVSRWWNKVRHRFPRISKWAANWGWVPPVVAATGALSFQEYCLAWLFTLTAALCLLAFIAHWEGLSEDPGLTQLVRWGGTISAIVLVVLGSVWIWGDMGDRPCSRLPGFLARIIHATKNDVPTPPALNSKPKLDASFFTLDPRNTPLREVTVPRAGNEVVVDLSPFNSGLAPAKYIHLWYRICDLCDYAEEPKGALHPEGASPFDRQFEIAEIDLAHSEKS